MKKQSLFFAVCTAITIFTVTSCKKDAVETPAPQAKEVTATVAKGIIEFIEKNALDNTVTSSIMIPIDQTFFVNTLSGGEDVHFSGQLHLVTKFEIVGPPIRPIRLFTNTVALKGIGRLTGLAYQLTGIDESFQNVTAGSAFSFVHSYGLTRFAAGPPIIPPNPIIPFRYSVQLNNAGEVIQADAIATFDF